MSDQGKAEAQAPASEAVADEVKTPVATKEETKAEVADEAAEAEEKPEAEASETPVEGAEEVETEEEKKTKSKLRRERQKAKEQALLDRIADLEAKAAANERAKPPADGLGPKPDRAKYEDEAEYAADLAAWKIEEKIIARQTKAHEANTSNVRNDSAAAKMQLFKERAMALTDRYPDIEAKVFNDTTLPMSATMAETLMESEKGPEVAYYLSANRETAKRIQEMSPLQAARELGRIEATLALPKPRTETKAPPPPSTLTGSTKNPSKDPNNMSPEEYRTWRENGGGVRRTG